LPELQSRVPEDFSEVKYPAPRTEPIRELSAALPDPASPPELPSADPTPQQATIIVTPERPGQPPAPHTTPAPSAITVGQQIVAAIAQFPDRPVELTLAPEELGKVSLTLASQDSGMSVHVRADRPETLDLMRRHIDQLARDFRDLGLGDVAFSFSGGQRDPGPGRQVPDTPVRVGPEPAALLPASATHTPRRAAPSDAGLDLRL
jgi:flagellar hook-length control protein FliK